MDIGRALPANVSALADALLELSDDGIAVLDGDATIARWNRRAAEYTGIATDAAVGASARDLFENADALLDVPAGSQLRRCDAVVGTGPNKRTLRAIVLHALVRAHGGKIHVVSRLDIGSTFTLWLPVRP